MLSCTDHSTTSAIIFVVPMYQLVQQIGFQNALTQKVKFLAFFKTHGAKLRPSSQEPLHDNLKKSAKFHRWL